MISLDSVLATADRLSSRFAARAAEYDREGTFPVDDFRDLADAGFFGLLVPEQLGGMGAKFADYVEVSMRLAAGNGATALVFNMHSSIIGALAQTSDDMARMLGAEESFFETRDRVCEEAAKGAFYAVAMSERGSGSRLSQVKTSYVPEPDGYRITGSKSFVSGAGHADAYLVAARSVTSETPEISHFLVPSGEGVKVIETWDSMGMRATGSHDVELDVHVHSSALLGGIEGLTIPLAQIMPQWLVASYSAVYVGVAQSAIDAAVEHIKSRNLASLPAVRARVGRADAAVAGAREVLRKAAQCVDNDPGTPETNKWIYRAKLTAGQVAHDVASAMLEAAGTSATRRGSALERIFRDARCGALQPATSDVCADWLGIAALGGNPDSDADTPRW